MYEKENEADIAYIEVRGYQYHIGYIWKWERKQREILHISLILPVAYA